MEYKRLGDIAPIKQAGIEPRGEEWLLNLDMVESNSGRIIEYVYVSPEEIGNSTISFDTSNVLYSKLRPYLNKVVLPERSGFATSEMLPLKPDHRIITRDYLTFFLRSKAFVDYINSKTAGAKMPRANTKDLKEVMVPCPDINRQERIAHQLSDCVDVIEKRHLQIKKLDDLIKARFVEMFVNDDKYPQEPLKDNVHEMFIGPFGSALKNECFVEKENGYCIVYEQKHAIQKTMDVPTRYVNEEKYCELKRFSVYPGDIIVSCRGTIGELFMIPEGAPLGIMHPSIMKIRLNTEKYNQQFFMPALEQYMEEHNNEAKGSGVKMAVTATTLGKELFVVPPINVQNQFSTFVEQIDKSKVVKMYFSHRYH